MDAGALTPRERQAFVLAALAVAVTRFLAISKTLWDWDEALFALAVRDYDVTRYHPQPPGFPLFIGAAKLLVQLAHVDGFRALQTLTVLSSLFVFPAAFLLARALRMPFFASMAAALLLAFAPNVWFYGGTAFSDVPSMVLVLFACALLLRGSTLGGATLLGIAAAIRPQSVLIAFVPMLLAFRTRRRTALQGAAIVAAIVIVSYGAAAYASGGWDAYRAVLARHEQYIRGVDSFLSPIRPSLLRVADDFFFWPYRAPLLNVAIVALALAGLTRRRAWLAVAIFAPFALFAWLYLDFHSVSRFSIGYAPLYALLAAEGIDLTRRARGFVLAALVGYAVVLMMPALAVVHRTPSPPVAAMTFVRARASRASSVLLVDERLAAHAELLLADYDRELVALAATARPPATMHARADVLVVREDAAAGGVAFMRARAPLASLVRPRYFETSVANARRITFGDGWYGEEGAPRAPWRWMGRASRLEIPAGASRIDIRFAVPLPTTIVIRADDRIIDHITTTPATVERTWHVANARTLTIETSAIAHGPHDPRELGLRLDELEAQ
ncbi:MAG: hypothetical protein JO197_12460 [Acidobacteria bacterium]|nr:hypothetical protein [Acidobacteriota bacterium]MBV9478319.1 hypothetical protein [Acidobacteriota bacterium]